MGISEIIWAATTHTTWADVAMELVKEMPAIATALGIVFTSIASMTAAILSYINKVKIKENTELTAAVAKQTNGMLDAALTAAVAKQTNGMLDAALTATKSEGHIQGVIDERQRSGLTGAIDQPIPVVVVTPVPLPVQVVRPEDRLDATK